MEEAARRLWPLTRSGSLRLLRSVPFGRVVFTHQALPAIRPVNHLVDSEDRIIIRAHADSSVTAIVTGDGSAVVAYEADLIDPAERLGWSVIVVGRARRLTDPAVAGRYREALTPWVTGTFDDIIAIETEMVDGFRMGRDAAGERDIRADRPGWSSHGA